MIITEKAAIIANKPRDEMGTSILHISNPLKAYVGSFKRQRTIQRTVTIVWQIKRRVMRFWLKGRHSKKSVMTTFTLRIQRRTYNRTNVGTVNGDQRTSVEQTITPLAQSLVNQFSINIICHNTLVIILVLKTHNNLTGLTSLISWFNWTSW